MTQYFNGMVWLDPKFLIPKNPYKALLYIKELRKPAINKVIDQMEHSPIYTQFTQGIEIIRVEG